MAIKIILADDHKITREGLRLLIEKQQDMEVVAEAENGRTAVELANESPADLVIMDVSMPDLNGIQAAKQILSNSPDIKVIALSMHSDALFVTEMLRSGAAGYLIKDCAFEELARAIRSVMRGDTYLSPSISRLVVDDYLHRITRESSNADILTNREKEVLQLLAEGKATKQIALKLHVSVKTVETHRRQIMDKLDMHSIAELTKYAIRKGFTSLES